MENEFKSGMENTIKEIQNMMSNKLETNVDGVIKSMGLDLSKLESYSRESVDSLVSKIEIKFVNTSGLEDPTYNHEEDSGFDLRANITESIQIKPLERVLVPTGLYFQIHPEYELQVRPRSGLAIKHGITVLNTPGTVDSNYRGEIKVILVNLSNESYTINRGDRIAQGVLSYVLKTKWINFNKTDKLNDTVRGDNGFGSTGKN
jgi:dUTP pyrophosphatase